MSSPSSTGGGGNFLSPVPKASSSVAGPLSEERTQRAQSVSTSTVSPTPSSSPNVSSTPDVDVQQQSSSTTSPPPSSTPTTQASEGVPKTAFYGFAAGLAALGLLIGGYLWYRRSRKQARKAAAAGNALRVRELLSENEPSPFGPPGPLLSSARSWTSTEWDARSQKTEHRPLEPSSKRPVPQRGVLMQNQQPTSNLARFEAMKEDARKENAERRAHFDALSEADDLERTAKMNVADEAVTQSDDSQLDVQRRGPAVNAKFRATRELRYQQKIEEGYTPSQAMSFSDASTTVEENSEAPGPFAGGGGRTRNPQSPLNPTNAATLPAIAYSPAANASSSTQYAPSTTPSRWRSHLVGDHSSNSSHSNPTPPPSYQASQSAAVVGAEGYSAVTELTQTEPDEVFLQGDLVAPLPAVRRPGTPDSARLSRIDLAFSETETGTRADTEISDDPWRDRVRENRRRWA